MSSVSSPTVSLTLGGGIGVTSFTKSEVDKGSIKRTSDDGLHVLQHLQSTTSKGRRRGVVRLQSTDPADALVTATCTVTVDFPEGNTTYGVIPAKALADFLVATTHEEVDLLASGHNLG